MNESRNSKPWEEQLQEAGQRIEEEVKRVVKYIDENVVPEVRQHSSAALRVAADRLAKLAEHLEDTNRKKPDDTSSGGQA